MTDKSRLIEHAFPLKQTSIDSVHEKNVRHGHISTLHIWPARRPLAACRAALIATLLPDPGNDEERKKILEKLGGKVVQTTKKKKMPSGKVEDMVVEETVGGILHWGRETSPDLEWFKEEIKKAYGGRAPKVLDPFAGGGAIPLEAMRLGCEVTAIDINPVAWFILKCTLEYPQRLAGKFRPLPKFALQSPEFMEGYFKGTGTWTKNQMERNLRAVQDSLFPPPDADLAWHVRAWGWWVLEQAKKDLESFYPVVNGKTTVAYLWARTVKCKSCRAVVPLLKTRWLCKKDKKRVLLTMEPNAGKNGVVFGVQNDVPLVGGNGAQRREHDKRIGAGTMSRSGATCPCCLGTIMTMEDIRLEGKAGRLGSVMTAVVVDEEGGKEYRLPVVEEIRKAEEAENAIEKVFSEIPFGLPEEPLPIKEALGFRVPLYGFDKWYKLFTPRQLLALGTFVKYTRAAREALIAEGYPPEWVEAGVSFLTAAFDRLTDYLSSVAIWLQSLEAVAHTFTRFALPINWDFVEANPLSGLTGDYSGALEWVSKVVSQNILAGNGAVKPIVLNRSSSHLIQNNIDIILTDPPYYDAIPYSDLMDFFYVWLRRTLYGLSQEMDDSFKEPLAPKWNHEQNDGELIDDSSRHGGDKAKSKAAYEDGMARVFSVCNYALKPEGRLVVVFANKQPNAWETLVSAIIRAGFVVDGSWPIKTERETRMRAFSSAALASSIWLVCKKRPEDARPGWDNHVLEEMRINIRKHLRDFWDAGLRGPDFVWAATGPALEAYSKHPVVKKADEPGEIMTVKEFLTHVRRMVVDFVVGRVLSGDGEEEAAIGLDDVTTYYLLHRKDLGMNDVPSGACILYAISCGLSDRDLADQYDLLAHTGGMEEEKEEDSDGEIEVEVVDEEAEMKEGSRSKVKLKTWQQRKQKNLGYEAPGGKPAPLIDQIHRLMHLWKAGDVVKVDEYLDMRGLRRNALFGKILQSLIELSGNEERSLLESISNHLATRGESAAPKQAEVMQFPSMEGNCA